MSRSRPKDSAHDADPPIKVCPHPHADFATLARHVAADFAAVDGNHLAQALRLARDAIDIVDLGPDGLRVAEVIARNLLLQRTGAVPDCARLDPQPHPGRSTQQRVSSLMRA
jgi:hypothetical protein